jgi:hypothetical protein
MRISYTSIGEISNTKPNPALLSGSDPDVYLPAFTLRDSSLERAGRS